MIEARLGPCLFRMAFGAGSAQTTPMRILFPVASDTPRCRLPILQVGCVTTFALDSRMGAQEREIRGSVIEILLIQPDYVLVPTLVIGMTMLAFGAFYLAALSMEPGRVIDIVGDVLVACQTEPDLRRFLEGLMAIPAILFVFLMALNHLARHHELFKNICTPFC